MAAPRTHDLEDFPADLRHFVLWLRGRNGDRVIAALRMVRAEHRHAEIAAGLDEARRRKPDDSGPGSCPVDRNPDPQRRNNRSPR